MAGREVSELGEEQASKRRSETEQEQERPEDKTRGFGALWASRRRAGVASWRKLIHFENEGSSASHAHAHHIKWRP